MWRLTADPVYECGAGMHARWLGLAVPSLSLLILLVYCALLRVGYIVPCKCAYYLCEHRVHQSMYTGR